MPAQPPNAGPARIMQLAWGHAAPIMIEAAVKNGVFDALEGAPLSLAEVAATTGASQRGLRALLNGLVGLELLSPEGDRYALAPEAAAFLVSSRPTYLGAFFMHMTDQLIPGWFGLPDVVRTGVPVRSVNSQAEGEEFFREFVEALLPMNFGAAQALAAELRPEAHDGSYRVLDIAAGSGVWSIPMAQRGGNVAVTAVDWPAVLPVTRRVAERFGVGDRYVLLSGDIGEVAFGSGFQAALLGHILHTEGPERARRLLQKVFEALAPGGTTAIAEFTPNDDRTGPPQPLIFAVNMLLHTAEGDTFTFAEISGWLREAGFENVRTLDVPAPSPLILATKPG
jgi:ubiquinone/menaquinone biosynthesis C-methylase UbiE